MRDVTAIVILAVGCILLTLAWFHMMRARRYEEITCYHRYDDWTKCPECLERYIDNLLGRD